MELIDEYRYWLAAFVLLVIVLYFMRPGNNRKTGSVTQAASTSPEKTATGKTSPEKSTSEKTASEKAGLDTTKEKLLLTDLKQACDNNDIKRSAKTLLELARIRWPDNPPMSIGALAKNVSEGKDALLEMDRCLYSGQTENWNGQVICKLFKHGFSSSNTSSAEEEPALKPLYPQ